MNILNDRDTAFPMDGSLTQSQVAPKKKVINNVILGKYSYEVNQESGASYFRD